MPVTLAVLPDTQIMTKNHPDLFRGIGDWLVANAARYGIDAVLHVGDVVNNGADDLEQWTVARAVYDTIAARLPIFVAAGNHDDDDQLTGPRRTLSHFGAEVGATRAAEADWWHDGFAAPGEDDGATNWYGILDLADGPLLVCVLEFAPRTEVLDWARRVLTDHPDTDAVIVTHAFLDGDGVRTRPGSPYHPDDYLPTKGDHDGEMMWAGLRRCPTLKAIFSGHQIPTHVAYRVDAADDGHLVLASFQNWQTAPDGGGGRIRLVAWDRDTEEITLSVVNTATGALEHDPGYDATISLAPDSADGGLQWPQ